MEYSGVKPLDPASLAGSIEPQAQVDLARVAVNPDRLIAGYRAGRAIHRVAGNVVTGMQHERRAVIWRGRNERGFTRDNIRVAVVMPSRLINVGKSVAGAERENGRER